MQLSRDTADVGTGDLGAAFRGIVYATADNHLRVLIDGDTEEYTALVDAVVAAHNPAVQTPAQTLDSEERANIAELVAKAQQALDAINADIDAIPTADLAALRGILTRALRREKRATRALVRLAREVMRIG